MEDFREVGNRLRNWGRWGESDERGTVNLITTAAIVGAAGLVKRGKVFQLSIPLDSTGPQLGPARINPLHLMLETGDGQTYPGGFRFADDYIVMPLQASSQLDALGHVFYDEQLYNGYASATITPHGAQKCAIDKVAGAIVGRGVLLDVAGYRGLTWLEAGDGISADELDEIAQEQGVVVGSGDILLVRTGWRRMYAETGDAKRFMAGEPGLDLSTCQWLRRKDVAAVLADNWAVEVLPSDWDFRLQVQDPPDPVFPLHMILIRDMGVSLGEILDFELLTDDCREDGTWEFLLASPALRVTHGVGSPINPLAVK